MKIKLPTKVRARAAIAVLGLLFFFCVSLAFSAETTRSLQVLSPVYSITKIYKSMQGPAASQSVTLIENQPAELVWITGFRTEIVGADGQSPMPEEFMCHINLDVDMNQHAQMFGWSKRTSPRLFTLSQAQFAVQFPKGFGMPVMSNETFALATQVLNHNHPTGQFEVRHKVTIDFVRDADLKKPLKPLFATNAFGMKLLEGTGGHFGMADSDESKHGASCLPGTGAPIVGASSVYPDGFGRKFSGHWVVAPGKEVDHTNVTRIMNVPFDTTLHYINIHLHPFAESIELRDLTSGKLIFKSRARGPKEGIGLAHIESYSSKKGIPVFKDHEYQLISRYNNTTGVDQDAMATMFLYLLDKEFKKPALAAVPPGHPYLILQTTAGDLAAELYPDVAPLTVAQIRRLAEAGVYDHTPFFRMERGFVLQVTNVHGRPTPLLGEQQRLIHTLPGEFSGIAHERGILSMARETADPNSGETSFSILLGSAPHLNNNYTVFGKLVRGWDVLQELENVPVSASFQPSVPIEVVKAQVVDTSQKLTNFELKGRKVLSKKPFR